MNNYQGPLSTDERTFILDLFRRSLQEAVKQTRAGGVSHIPVADIVDEITSKHGLALSPSVRALWCNRLSTYSQDYAAMIAEQSKKGALSFSVGLGHDAEIGGDIRSTDRERAAGMFVIGSTGSRKTTMMTHMALGDIEHGHGMIFLDVDGDSTDELLLRIPNKRMKDVILLDLSARDRYIGINPLAGLHTSADAERLLEVFKRLFKIGPETPNLINTLRASLLTLGYAKLSISEMPDLLEDSEFRKRCVATLPSSLPDESVRKYWQKYDELSKKFKTEPDASTLNKVLQFLMQEQISYVVSQSATTIDFRSILDSKKIVLLRLSKHDLGEEQLRFIAVLLMAELKNALFSRADVKVEDRGFFGLYADEWELYLTDDFQDILTRGRKYGIGAVLANQALTQLDEGLRAITQQLNTKVTFRVGADDATKLARYYARDPQPEYKEQEKKLPVTRPVNWLVGGSRAHGSAAVNDFVKRWEEIVRDGNTPIREGTNTRTSISRSPRGRVTTRSFTTHWSNRAWVMPAREGLELINDVLYQVMQEKNPRLPVLLELAVWCAKTFDLPFLQAGFNRPPFPPHDYLFWLLETTVNGETRQPTDAQLALYQSVWEVPDDRLPQAFTDIENAARTYLYETLSPLVARFLEDSEKVVEERRDNGYYEQYWLFSNLRTCQRHSEAQFLDLDVLPVRTVHTRFQFKTASHVPLTPGLQTFPKPLTMWWWYGDGLEEIATGLVPLIVSCVLQRRGLQGTQNEQLVRRRVVSGLAETVQNLKRDRDYPTTFLPFVTHPERLVQMFQLSDPSWANQGIAFESRGRFHSVPSTPSEVRDAVIQKVRSEFMYKLRYGLWDDETGTEAMNGAHSLTEEEQQSLEELLTNKLQLCTFLGQGRYWEVVAQEQTETDLKTAQSMPGWPHFDEAMSIWHCYTWRLISPGWEDVVKKQLQEEIDRIVAEQKPVFEGFVTEIRAVCDALATSPILAGSGEYVLAPVGQRSYADMLAEMAGELVNLADGLAYVAIGSRGERYKPLLETLPLSVIEEGMREQLLQERKAHALENAKAYTTAREDIEAKVRQRRAACMSDTTRQPQSHMPVIEESEAIARQTPAPPHGQGKPIQSPQPHSTTRRVCAASGSLPLQHHPVVCTDEKTTADTYLTLLYYCNHLTLQQAVRLTGKQTSVNNERAKLTKLVKDGLVVSEPMKESGSSGKSPLVYSVTPKGYKYLETEKGLPPLKKGDYTHHSYQVNETLIPAILAAKTQETMLLVGFEHEKMFRMKPLQLPNGKGVEPDSLLTYQVGQTIAPIALECDLSIETREQLIDKVKKYLQALQGSYQERFGVDALTIAFVIPNGSENDVTRLVGIVEAALEHDKEAAPLFLVGAFDPLNIAPGDLLFTPLFYQPFDANKHALIQE